VPLGEMRSNIYDLLLYADLISIFFISLKQSEKIIIFQIPDEKKQKKIRGAPQKQDYGKSY